jgi:heat shock protein HtpX
MDGVGLQTTIWNNRLKSIFLLLLFPVLVLFLTWLCFLFFGAFFYRIEYHGDTVFVLRSFSEILSEKERIILFANAFLIKNALLILSMCIIWYIVAWFNYNEIIFNLIRAQYRYISTEPYQDAKHSLETLSITCGITTPDLIIIDSIAYNSMAIGIQENKYSIIVTNSLIDNLKNEEIEGVFAYHITQIVNGTVQFMMVSTIFVGMFSMIYDYASASLNKMSKNQNSGRGSGVFYLFIWVFCLIGYPISFIIHAMISQKLIYSGDLSAVSITKNNVAYISALKKIRNLAYMHEFPKSIAAILFHYRNAYSIISQTHPEIDERILLLGTYA